MVMLYEIIYFLMIFTGHVFEMLEKRLQDSPVFSGAHEPVRVLHELPVLQVEDLHQDLQR